MWSQARPTFWQRPFAGALVLLLLIPLLLVVGGTKAYAAPVTSVGLTSSSAQVGAGQSATLTATADTSLSGSGTYLQVFDVTAGRRLDYCSGGSTCTAVAGFEPGASGHDFRAWVGPLSTTAPTTGPSSNVVTITYTGYTLSLASSLDTVSTSESATLTATANQSVSGTPYYVLLYDRTTGRVVEWCKSGSTCSASVSVRNEAHHDYVAYVARDVGGTLSASSPTADRPTDAQATSDAVRVQRQEWALTLSASASTISTSQSAVLTASANQTVSGTDYYVIIYDRTTGRVVEWCKSGVSCSAGVSIRNEDHHDYVAYVAKDVGGTLSTSGPTADRPTNLQAVSGVVRVERQKFVAKLSTDKVTISSQETSVLSADVNQTVSGTDYYVIIYDRTTGRIVNWCKSGTTCTAAVAVVEGDPHTYVAYVARDMGGTLSASSPTADRPTGKQAVSGVVVIARQTWAVALSTSGSSVAARANQSASGTPYYVVIYDRTTGRIVNWCKSGTTCTAGVTAATLGNARIAYVARDVGGTLSASSPTADRPTDLQASSNGYSRNNGAGYVGAPLRPEELGASVNSCHGLEADPIDTASGAMTESVTDLTIPARGAPLCLTRSYHSTRTAGLSGSLGAGWRIPWDSRLVVAGQEVTITQEGGDAVVFRRGGDGSYSAPAHVLASLAATGGGYRLVRRGVDVLEFDTSGRLAAVGDLAGNRIFADRDGAGVLTALRDGAGRRIVLAYSGGRISSVTSPGGQVVSYGYDSKGRLSSVVDAAGAKTGYGYDVAGRITSKTTPLGGVVATSYDSSGRAVEQVDEVGGRSTFSYDGDATTFTDAVGGATLYRYANGQVASRTQAYGTPEAATTTYSYDPLSQAQTQVVDPMGAVSTSTYDAFGYPTSESDPLGRTTRWTHDGAGRVTSQTDPRGVRTQTTYTAAGSPASVSTPHGSDSSTTRYEYDPTRTTDVVRVVGARGEVTALSTDAYGNQVKVADALGRVTTKTFDLDGRVLAVTAPDGAKTTYSYDGAGRITASTDPVGAVSKTAYDGAGNAVAYADATGLVTRSLYDGAGRLVKSVLPTGVTMSYEYDGVGRLLVSQDGAGASERRSYDQRGNLVRTVDPLGRATTYSYDRADRLVRQVDPSGALEVSRYDAAGQLTSATDAAGGTTSYTYDAAGLPSSTTDPLGRVTKYDHDEGGRLTSTTRADGSVVRDDYDVAGLRTRSLDAAGGSVAYTYDAVGDLAGRTDQLGRSTGYARDAAGRVSSHTDATGATTRFSYDGAGRQVGVDHPGATPDVTSTYDAAGRLLTTRDGAGTTTRSYEQGRVVKVREGDGSSVGYTYDALGRVVKVAYPDGLEVQRIYDGAGQWIGVKAGADFVDYTYTPGGDLALAKHSNGVVQTNTRDAAGRLTELAYSKGASALAKFGYGLGADSALTSATEGGSTTTYAYTPLNQLAGVGAASLSYGPLGSATKLLDGSAVTHDAAGQLMERTSGSTSTRFAFDANGSRTRQGAGIGATAYGYDAAAHLTSLASPSAAETYGYDGSGLRATRTAGGVSERFVYDRTQENEQLLVDGGHDYVYGPDGLVALQVALGSGEVEHLHADRIGSARLLTGASGVVVGTAAFGAYGAPAGATGVASRFGFAGEYADRSGLVYLRARYYDPATAQFLTVDPLVDATRDAYGYADADPLNRVDPSGTCAQGFGWACSSGAYLWDHKRQIGRGALVVGTIAASAACVAATAGICAAPLAAAFVVAGIGVTAGAADYALSEGCKTAGGYAAAAAIGGITGGRGGSAGRLAASHLDDVAKWLGYKEVRGALPGISRSGVKVYKKGTSYITPDVGSSRGFSGATAHRGGAWKMYDKKGNRVGTYDDLLDNQVGK